MRDRGDTKTIVTGAIFLAFGLVGALMALRYDLGTPTRVGPGGFPLLLSAILGALGIANIVFGISKPYRGGIGSWRARGIYLIPLSVIFFGVTVERIGLVFAIVGTVIIACLANPSTRMIEIAIMCAALAAFGAGLFVHGLHLPFSLWPG